MSLVEEYYELNEAEEVSSLWKVIQIVFYLAAASLGLWCGYTIAILRIEFQDKCYLFTSIKFPVSKLEKIDPGSVSWENDTWCDYCQFSMVSSFIVATIWATFFLMCGKGGKSLTGLPQPWRIVWPSLVFNLIYFVVALSVSINVQQGTDQFCLRREFNDRINKRSLPDDCEPLKYLLHKNRVEVTSLQLEIAAKSSWGCTISWLVLLLISFFRIVFVIDFHMYRVCVFKIDDSIQNKKEEVVRITNYEEPKKMSQDYRPVPYAVSFEEDEGEGKRRRSEKKPTRQYFQLANRPIQPNSAFYVTADLRMLNREKKGGKMSRSLDKSFEKHLSSLSWDPKVGGVKMKSDLRPLGTSISLGTKPRALSFGKLESFSSLAETEDEYSGTEERENSEDGSTYFGANESDPESLLGVEAFKSHTSIRIKKTL